MQEVHSASTELLTSNSLKELKHVIQTAYVEHEDISGQLEAARQEKERASERFLSWQNGFLFKKLFKANFARRKAEADTSTAKVAELEEQLRLTTIATQVEIAPEQAEPYFKMRDTFALLSESGAVWDIKSYQTTDKFHERTTTEGCIRARKLRSDSVGAEGASHPKCQRRRPLPLSGIHRVSSRKGSVFGD
jgi:outer membrane receptor for ferric coprogen and ferric-rhodotorulic acid